MKEEVKDSRKNLSSRWQVNVCEGGQRAAKDDHTAVNGEGDSERTREGGRRVASWRGKATRPWDSFFLLLPTFPTDRTLLGQLIHPAHGRPSSPPVSRPPSFVNSLVLLANEFAK